MNDPPRGLPPYTTAYRTKRWRGTLPLWKRVLVWAPLGVDVVMRLEMRRLGGEEFRRNYLSA